LKTNPYPCVDDSQRASFDFDTSQGFQDLHDVAWLFMSFDVIEGV
jgi:hypothetical protein